MEHHRGAFHAGGSSSRRGRGYVTLGFGGRRALAAFTSTTTATTSTITTLAALAAEEATALVATAALLLATASCLATAAIAFAALVAEEATALVAATTGRATTTITASGGGLLAAHKGETNDREENRDPKHNSSIHSSDPPKTYRYRKRAQYSLMPST